MQTLLWAQNVQLDWFFFSIEKITVSKKMYIMC